MAYLVRCQVLAFLLIVFSASAQESVTATQPAATPIADNSQASTDRKDASDARTPIRLVQRNGDPLPEGVRVTPIPEVLEALKGHEGALLRYRKTENKPGFFSKEALAQDTPVIRRIKELKLVGIMPRLNILPCEEGCTGNSDYAAAVKTFQAKYEKGVADSRFTFNGVMPIKVRWYKERGYVDRLAHPFTHDVFAVSFALEGKVVTLSAAEIGTKPTMDRLTTWISGMLGVMLMTDVAKGTKPAPLMALLPEEEQSWWKKTNDAAVPLKQMVDSIFNEADYRSRIEPMLEADNVLLPAIDGIGANEIDPIAETVYLNHI